QEQPRNRLGFEARMQLARIDIVVLDGVTGPDHPRLFQSRDGPEEGVLYIGARARFASMMACVASVVCVMWQTTCGVVIFSVKNEKGCGGSSPCCTWRPFQLMVRPSRRGGVPVLSRLMRRPSPYSRSDRPRAGASLMRPAGILRSPIWIRPRRKVPVVRTTAPAEMLRPSAVSTPLTLPHSTRRSSTAA